MSQAAYRAAAISFLTDYAATLADGVPAKKLQIYPGRPRTVNPPTGFVDAIRETYNSFTEHYFQRTPQVDVIVVFGLFDSRDAVEQKDAFVDGLVAWVYANPHKAGSNTLISVASTEDIPAFVNDWVQPSEQRTYFATTITLEGFGTN